MIIGKDKLRIVGLKKTLEKSFIIKDECMGSLMYGIVCTRLGIAYVIGVVNIFLSNIGNDYWNVVKWILPYLRGFDKKCLYLDVNMSKTLYSIHALNTLTFGIIGYEKRWIKRN
ncbi:hypothetical protein CR513_27758, partial [Mucuna pruriens]